MSANISIPFTLAIDDTVDSIRQQTESRSYKAANELRNAALEVLRGQRSGRRYRVPGTNSYYTASAPGEPPAARTAGGFRTSWKAKALVESDVYTSRIESDKRTDNGKFTLGEILEEGTPGGQMAPRPHHERIIEKAMPEIERIYSEPYF